MIPRLFATATAVALLLSSPASAQDETVQETLRDHEQRMDRMDSKLDAILDMLTRQASDAAAPAPAAPASTVGDAQTSPAATGPVSAGPVLTADDFAPGLLYELFVIPGRELSASIDYPAGYFVDEAPPKFSFARFLDDQNLVTNAELPSDFVLESRWTGFLKIQHDGAHVFLVNTKKDNNSYEGPYQCLVSFKLNDEDVFNIDLSGSRLNQYQDKIDLERGIYPFQVFMKCHTDGGWRWSPGAVSASNLVLGIKIKTPSERSPSTPDSGAFIHIK